MRRSLYLAAVALVANVTTGIPLGPKGSFFYPAIPSTNISATLKLLHNAHDRAKNGSEGIPENKTEATAKHDVELPKKIEDRPVTHQYKKPMSGLPWTAFRFSPYRSYKDKDIGRGKRVAEPVGIIRPMKREDGKAPKKIDDVPAADGGEGVAGKITDSTTKHYSDHDKKMMRLRRMAGLLNRCPPLTPWCPPLTPAGWDKVWGHPESNKTVTPTKRQAGEMPKKIDDVPATASGEGVPGEAIKSRKKPLSRWPWYWHPWYWHPWPPLQNLPGEDKLRGHPESNKTVTPTKKQDGEVPKRSQKFPWVGKTPPEGLGKRDTTYRPIRITEFNSEGEVVKEQTLMRKIQA